MQQRPDMAAVLAAAEAAGAHEMILDCAAGYDTPMTAQGAPLSGGQAQRVSLARALFGDPGLILLDEPEAHLDAEGRQHLAKTLANLCRAGRSVVLASHSPEILAQCDMVLRIEAGLAQSLVPRAEAAAGSPGRDAAPGVSPGVRPGPSTTIEALP